MRSPLATAEIRRSFWLHVRTFAVPPAMIEAATARRRAGDWAGACAAARVDVDLDLRGIARTHGRDLTRRLRADLRALAPDLLRWHLPRIRPDGLLRPGLTISLARYELTGEPGGRTLRLVVRTPPRWADAGQRLSLAVWDGTRSGSAARRHPHPHPDRRFRFDLHRHLWDAHRADALRVRSGADLPPVATAPDECGDLPRAALRARGCDVDRWAAEAQILLRADGLAGGAVAVRCGARDWRVLDLVTGTAGGPPDVRIRPPHPGADLVRLPVLPDAATWILPDLELVRSGQIDADGLHPLVAAALLPGRPAARHPHAPSGPGWPRLVECRGTRHRIDIVNGELVALDHDPAELRREELLAALTGTPLSCLRMIDRTHRRPERLAEIRARLGHGDVAGALRAVEDLLGRDAVLRPGALRDELESAAERRIAHGLFRNGLVGTRPAPPSAPRGVDRARARRTRTPRSCGARS